MVYEDALRTLDLCLSDTFEHCTNCVLGKEEKMVLTCRTLLETIRDFIKELPLQNQVRIDFAERMKTKIKELKVADDEADLFKLGFQTLQEHLPEIIDDLLTELYGDETK